MPTSSKKTEISKPEGIPNSELKILDVDSQAGGRQVSRVGEPTDCRRAGGGGKREGKEEQVGGSSKGSMRSSRYSV
jgi:hypothetical protein